MDPISLTASIIAVVGLAGEVGKNLRSLRHISHEIHSLVNDVSDLQAVLGEVDRVVIQYQVTAHVSRETILKLSNTVDTARHRLSELNELVKKSGGVEGKAAVVRLKWLRARTRAMFIQQSLRDLKMNLVTILGTLCSLDISRVHLKLDEVTLVARDIAAAHQAFQQNATQQLHFLKDGFSRIELLSTDQDQTRHTIQELHSALSATGRPSSENALAADNQTILQRISTANPPDEFQGIGQLDSQHSTLLVKTSYYWGSPCRPGCNCMCHKRQVFKSPSILNRLIGSLFIGYSGLPITTPKCTEFSCQRRAIPSTQISYSFPSWFLQRQLLLSIFFTPLDGPVLSLKVPRLVSPSSKIFDYALLGNVAGMKFLFREGLASPNDVRFDCGVSALQQAADHRQIEMCRFLLSTKADPFMEDHAFTSAMDAAWTQILSNILSLEEENEMRLLFNDTDCLEKRQFSPIHDIVLGLRKGDVESEAVVSSSFINSRDSNGRTPLSWAAGRGDFRIVGSLIRLGANPNIVSACDMSPLHFAMRPTSPRCIVPLLAAGARVDQLSDWQQTPLHHAAAYQDDIRFLEPLVDSGAEVNARDRDGNTPLGCAALANHAQSAAFLLACGADIDSQTPTGWNALLMSVDCNSHTVLRLLLQRGANHTYKLSTGCTILHRAAERGDIETLAILAAAGLRDLDVDAVNAEKCTARDLTRRRDRASATEFDVSFDALLQSIQPRADLPRNSQEDDDDNTVEYADAEEYLT